jgi:hypothetical protein
MSKRGAVRRLSRAGTASRVHVRGVTNAPSPACPAGASGPATDSEGEGGWAQRSRLAFQTASPCQTSWQGSVHAPSWPLGDPRRRPRIVAASLHTRFGRPSNVSVVASLREWHIAHLCAARATPPRRLARQERQFGRLSGGPRVVFFVPWSRCPPPGRRRRPGGGGSWAQRSPLSLSNCFTGPDKLAGVGLASARRWSVDKSTRTVAACRPPHSGFGAAVLASSSFRRHSSALSSWARAS